MRLKEIEKRYANGYRNGFLIDTAQKENDMEWLMDQAEKVEKYEKEIKLLNEQLTKARASRYNLGEGM